MLVLWIATALAGDARHTDLNRMLEQLGMTMEQKETFDRALSAARPTLKCGTDNPNGFNFYDLQCSGSVKASTQEICVTVATATLMLRRIEDLDRGVDKSYYLTAQCGAQYAEVKASNLLAGNFHQGQTIVEAYTRDKGGKAGAEPQRQFHRVLYDAKSWTASSSPSAGVFVSSAPAATSPAALEAWQAEVDEADRFAAETTRAAPGLLRNIAAIAWVDTVEKRLAARRGASSSNGDAALNAAGIVYLEAHVRLAKEIYSASSTSNDELAAVEARVARELAAARATWDAAVRAYRR